MPANQYLCKSSITAMSANRKIDWIALGLWADAVVIVAYVAYLLALGLVIR